MSNLTVIFLTENKLPPKWMKYQRKVLLEAAKDHQLITISRKPIQDMGLNLIQKKPSSLANIWWQMLRGAKKAKTKYIAVAEDDTLYHSSHFIKGLLTFRKLRKGPGEDFFLYNVSNWKMFNWGNPVYHSPFNTLNYTLVAPRKLVIAALKKRFKRGLGWRVVGELGRRKVSLRLGYREAGISTFSTIVPVININHDMGFDPRAQNHTKPRGSLRVLEVPYWGRAEDLIKKFV